MLSSLLGNFLSNVGITPKKVKQNSNSDFLKRRKLVIREFATVDPNNNLIRAKIAKRLLSMSRNETERKAARKFYKDEMELYSLRQKIKAVTSINEKLRLAREGRRLATKQQREYWDGLIDKLQKLKAEKTKTEKKKMLVKKEDKLVEEVIDEKDSKEIDEDETEETEEAEEKDNNDDSDEDEDGNEEEGDNEDSDTDNDKNDENEKTDGMENIDDDLNLTGDDTDNDRQDLI